MFHSRILKVFCNLGLLVVLCVRQVAATPNQSANRVESNLFPSSSSIAVHNVMPLTIKYSRQVLMTAGDTIRVSVASDGTQGNNFHMFFSSISADGRYVAFASQSNNLVSGDTNGAEDIFVYTMQTGTTTRVSVALNGAQANGGSSNPSISADGRYIAFHSGATNLVSGDTNGKYDVFVRDTQMNTTTRVSLATNGVQADGFSSSPTISADGRYVAFQSDATNLISGDTNGKYDVFVRDMQTNTTIRVSLSSDGMQGNDDSRSAGFDPAPSISSDGRYVAFESSATNLVSGDTNGDFDIFVRDTHTNTTTRVSVSSDGAQGNRGSNAPSISADGRYVAFSSDATNLVSGDTNTNGDTFIRDLQANTTTRVSVATDGSQGIGNYTTPIPSISADGHYVAFLSGASNLVSGDTNAHVDVFVRNLLTNTTTRVSVASDGTQGNDDSSNPIVWTGPSISGDGRYVAFSSLATNLVSDDTNGLEDIFVHENEVIPTSKLPIVFIHGWNGFGAPPPFCSSEQVDPDSYFEQVDESLQAAGYYVGYAYLESSPCYTPPLVDNVDNLEAAIDQAKAANPGQDKVILIAHSMGGLVARAYIEGPNYKNRNDVTALFTFGSPHLGTPEDGIAFLLNDASLGWACENYQPAACDFSVLGMKLFNMNHHKNNNVIYHVISGNVPFLSLILPQNALGLVTYPFIGPGDGIVPISSGSANSLGNFDRFTTTESHNTRFGSNTYFSNNGNDSASYTDCIKKVLVDGASNCGTVSLGPAAPQDNPVMLAQRTPLENGILQLGQTATRNLSLEGGSTLFASQWQNGTLAFTLIDPNGETIDPAFAVTNPGVVTYSGDANAAAYYFPNAMAGTWQMVLRTVSVPTSATFTTFAAFDSTITLTGSADKDWYTPGANAAIIATLEGLPSNATIIATILRADGVTDTLPLSPIGGGQYQASYIVPNAPGYAEVRLVASGTTASSLPFERGASLVFQISPNTFTLNNTYADTPILYPGLSLYQFLTFAVGINATVSGKVGLSADLVDGSGNFVAHGLTIQDVAAGIPTLTLQFNGADIFASQHNGPYTLTNVLLTDESGATLVTQQAQAVYTTTSYLYTNFISPSSFADVPLGYWANSFIERLYAAGITGGCSTSPLMYCPEVSVNRAQMAVFLLRGKHGNSYVPPIATGTVFGDVPANYWAAAWIEQLYVEGITGGCGSGNYCPETPVTRDQMAVFLLRAEHGSAYTPPDATGVFTDVPTGYWAAAWIEQLAVEGITAGCGGGNYCPSTVVNRAQMAVFLVRTFSLP